MHSFVRDKFRDWVKFKLPSLLLIISLEELANGKVEKLLSRERARDLQRRELTLKEREQIEDQ